MFTTLTSQPIEHHARYIKNRVYVAFFRSILGPVQWLQKHKMHDGVHQTDFFVQSRDQHRQIKVHLYESDSEETIKKPKAVLINLHGSGFVVPSLSTDREFCSLVASRTPILVFDADYRKAPEYPFPAPLDDVEDIVHFLEAHPEQYDLSKIFLGGFSAGGNIALAAASMLGPRRIKGVIGFYPSVDLTKEHFAPEKIVEAGGNIPNAIREIFYSSYLPPEQSRSDPRVSPSKAAPETFPKFIYLSCGNADDLYGPVEELSETLQAAGHSDVRFTCAERQGHGFDKQCKEGSPSETHKHTIYDGAVDMIKRALEAEHGDGQAS